jgi:polyhydroxyalkanoate synthesis regulator phasin
MLKKVDAWENAEFDKRYKVELKDGYYVIKDTRGNDVYNKKFNTENEARDYGRNEIFARGFEQYLRTGKAPSNYLKSAFKSFWNWLRTLYRSAKQLNADINDDIETVYGTILGGTDLDFYLNEEPGAALQKKFIDNEERNKYIEENISKAQAMATEPKMFENFVAEKTESKKGKAEFLTSLIVPISTRAKRVSQGLKNKLRAYDYALPQKINEYNARIKPFMDKWAKFTQDDMVAFDLALKNDYVTKQLEILEKYDALDDFEAVHDLLNYLYEEAQSVGVEMGYRENYFPREVADVDGLMSYLYGPRAISELRRAEREAHYEDMTPDEQAEFVNKFLRGYERKDLTKSLPGNVKERRIDVVTSDMNMFYKNSMQALMTYIERMTNSIESRRFWGMDAAHIEDSIGAFVDEMIEQGEIKPDQDKEVEKILRARFKARGVSNKFLLYQKNMAYIYTMGGINSAITQIDDISVALYKAGLWNTVQSIFAPKHKGLSREELGLTRIGEEFMEASATSKAVSAVFKATGLDKIDAFGKNVLINATFKKFQKMAKSNEAKLREYLEPIMEQETDATIEAIKNDEITDNVKLLMFNELADMQPISLSEMPEYYLTSGNGRVLYMLKTFALKRIDIFRNECFDKMRKGEVKSGLQNLFKLSMLMMLCGMGKDAIIDLLFGRRIILEDSVVNNLLGLFGFSKYQLYRARSDGFTGLLTSVAVPPILPMWSDLFKDLYKSLFTKNGEDIENWEVWKGIPIIGRFYYWWMGGGYAKEQKKKKKLK